MKLDFFLIKNNKLITIQKQLSDLERNFTYPFGSDRFKIDHGENYFDFFKTMGKVSCFGYKLNDQIVASAICILRNINHELVWYLADLKVYSKINNINLISKLKQDAFSLLYNKTNKFYAINMNSPSKKHGVIAKVLNRGLPIKIEYANDLAIYLLDLPQLNLCANYLLNYCNMVNMQGKKDLILQNTNSRIPLIHLKIEKKPVSKSINDKYLKSDNKFMFCTSVQSSLHERLAKDNILPVASAAIIHSGMQNNNWQFINTCEL